MSGEPRKYELLERIGAGGMSEVYRARLPGAAGFQKIVVVKRLLPHLQSEAGMVEMFVGEAKLAAEVHHPNIVQVFELQQAPSGEFFIVMEYVEGTDLRRLSKQARRARRAIPPWLGVHVVAEVLDGLAFVHDLTDKEGRLRNVVHRDVAPDNIFISTFGDVKLGDFGVAKDDLRGLEPYAEQLKGKYGYMSPEQFSNKPVDRRCDLFAVGVVLWETLTGQPLFRTTSPAETARRVCRAPRRAPSSLAPGIPPELDHAVLRALAVDPNDRPQHARELQAELLEILPRLYPGVSPVEVRRAIEELTSPLVEGGATQTGPADAEVAPPREAPAFRYGVRRSVETEDLLPEREEAPPFPSPVATAASEGRRGLGTGGSEGRPIERRPESRVPWRQKRATGGSATPTTARRWVPYDGPHAFWVRVRGGVEFGPCCLTDIMLIVRSKLERETRDAMEISGDRARWMPYSTFLRLTAQDELDREEARPTAPLSRTLEASSCIALFGLIAEKKLTGRFTLYHRSPELVVSRDRGVLDGPATEVHVVAGKPTHVISSDAELETPGQILVQGLAREDQLASCLHRAVTEERTLRQALLETVGVDIEAYWLPFMLARLAPVVAWEVGACVYRPICPDYDTPFAPSLLALLPRLVQSARSAGALETLLSAHLELPHERTERFERLLPELALTEAETVALQPFGFTRTLHEAVRSSRGGATFGLIMGHILLELGMLRPKVSVAPGWARLP